MESIFVDILHNLLTLEHLAFDNMVLFDEDSEQHAIIYGKLNVVRPGQLKSLSLSFNTSGRYTSNMMENGDDSMMMKKCNDLFKFVLGSCPLLEEFKLNGWIGAYSALNLDFRQHDQLKYIGIDLKGCRYYIFDNNFDMKWKNVAIQMLKSDITQFELLHYYPYFINLAWITNNNVKLQLSGSKASG